MVDLKEYKPETFYLYMDNPPLLDLLTTSAIELNKRRMLQSTLHELATAGTYAKLSCELDRFAQWLVDMDIVSLEKMGDRLTLNRAINPIAQHQPKTIMDLLKAIEICVGNSKIDEHVKKLLIKEYAEFFPLFNRTLLQ